MNKLYKIDNNFFNDISDEVRAYWLGFLYADGSVSKKETSVTITLKDREHLEKLKSLVQPALPIRVVSVNSRGYYSITFASVSLVKALITHGCVPQKTLKLKFPDGVQKELLPHFIRGYFDGDGCLTGSYQKGQKRNKVKKWKWSIVSTENFCKSVQVILSELGIHSKIDQRHKDNEITKNLNVCGRKNIAIVMAYIYGGANVYLDRKLDKYKEFLQELAVVETLKNVNRKFSDFQIAEMCKKYIPRKYTYKQLADEYGCCEDTILKALTGKQYKTK